MNRREQVIFWSGTILLAVCFSLTAWLLLPLFAWYIKHIPDRRLPLTDLLASNHKRFYDWLSGFLWDWFKSFIFWTIIAGVVIALVGAAGIWIASELKLFSIRDWLTQPPLMLLVGYGMFIVINLHTFFETKSAKWDALFWQAEPTVRVLVGNEEYEIMPEEDRQRVKRNIVDSLIGINKATLVVAGGKIQTHNPPAGDLAKFGGPGILIVQEGHAVVLERGGRRSRIVGTGVHQLGMFERVNTVIPLMPRSFPLEIENVITQDHVLIEKIKLQVFTRLDLGDQSHENGDYPFDDKIINDKVWSPRLGPEVYDWSGVVKSVTDTALRDLAARLMLDDIVLASGAARERLRTDLRELINRVTKERLGVVVDSVVISEIKIPEQAREGFLQHWLAEVNRRTALINANTEREKLVLKGEGEAQSVRRIGLAKTMVRDEIIKLLVSTITETSQAGSPITDPKVAVRFVAAIERLSTLVMQDNAAVFEYITALEKLCESPSARTIILGDARGALQLPGHGNP